VASLRPLSLALPISAPSLTTFSGGGLDSENNMASPALA
jgi:hypothetical protein